jgi:hypothetical protein
MWMDDWIRSVFIMMMQDSGTNAIMRRLLECAIETAHCPFPGCSQTTRAQEWHWGFIATDATLTLK